MTIDLGRVRVCTTPALVLIRQTLERNLDLLQARCVAAGVGLRAHGKMHKCSTLARLQIAKGAVGICAQTIGEAEAFTRGGIADILLTSPVSLRDSGRVAALYRTGIEPGAVVALAKTITASTGTRFIGIQGYLGSLAGSCETS